MTATEMKHASSTKAAKNNKVNTYWTEPSLVLSSSNASGILGEAFNLVDIFFGTLFNHCISFNPLCVIAFDSVHSYRTNVICNSPKKQNKRKY